MECPAGQARCIDSKTFQLSMNSGGFTEGVRVFELERAGHFLQHDRPSDVTAMLVAFMQKGFSGFDEETLHSKAKI